jgi:hemerythrin-like domain-containing protein
MTVDNLTDTRMMKVVHSFYRRELRLMGGVVRAVPPEDIARAGVVADHLDLVGRHLHHHHTTEDRLLWPLLLERVPEELAPIVHLMESQHAQVDAIQAEIAGVLPRWRASAEAEDRERLAGLCDRLYLHLAEHLDAEEERLLPLAARSVTQEEWDRLGEEGRRGTPRSEMSLTYGMFAYDGDPAVVAGMLAEAPWPVRLLVPWLGRRAFRSHAVRIHGTATP